MFIVVFNFNSTARRGIKRSLEHTPRRDDGGARDIYKGRTRCRFSLLPRRGLYDAASERAPGLIMNFQAVLTFTRISLTRTARAAPIATRLLYIYMSDKLRAIMPRFLPRSFPKCISSRARVCTASRAVSLVSVFFLSFHSTFSIEPYVRINESLGLSLRVFFFT